MTVNHIFLRHFMTEDHQEPGLAKTEHDHTYEFYKRLKNYTCPLQNSWAPNIEYEINVTPTISYNEVGLIEEDILKKDKLNIVWVPMHYPTWRWFDTFYPDVWRDLDILADPNSEYPTAVVFDYNNETLFPGNFDDQEGQLEVLAGKDFSQFYCSTLSWNRDNVLDTIGFRQIISNYSCLGGLSILPALEEDPELYNGFGLEDDTNYTIRYFCPNNVFRPNRGMGIVKMYHKGMLDDTEWSMNKFSQWHEMDRFIQLSDTEFISYVDEYFDLFGKTPRQMSYPWNKTFNQDKINQDRGDHSMRISRWHDAFPHDLMEKTYIYISQQVVTSKTTEEPINPLKPVHVGDWDEKILKGFLYNKPTFINGRQGSVKIMEELGFDMLTDYYSDDYDNEPDDIVRIDKMLECAKNFPDMNSDIKRRILNNNALVRSKKFWWDSQSELMKILLDNHPV